MKKISRIGTVGITAAAISICTLAGYAQNKIAGDLDGDQMVTQKDALIGLQYILGLKELSCEAFDNANMNPYQNGMADNRVTIGDIAKLLIKARGSAVERPDTQYTVQVEEVTGIASGIVSIFYTATDLEGDSTDLEAEISTDGGNTWQTPTALEIIPEDSLQCIKGDGQQRRFRWNATEDLGYKRKGVLEILLRLRTGDYLSNQILIQYQAKRF